MHHNKFLITFSYSFFLKQCIKYLSYYSITLQWSLIHIILINIIILLDDINILNFKNSINLNVKQVSIIKEKGIYESLTNLIRVLINYINTNKIIDYRTWHYLIFNIIILLSKQDSIPLHSFEWLHFAAISSWTFLMGIFIRNKYKDLKSKYNFDAAFWSSKYQNNKIFYSNFDLFKKVHFKYFGNYDHYLYVKKFLQLNNLLNRRYLLTYNFKKNKFMFKLNQYYKWLKDDINQSNITNLKKTDYIHYLFNVSLKGELDSPFLNDDLPFTFYSFKQKLNKKKLRKYSNLISLEYLKYRKKKGTLSKLSKEELDLIYKNFYKLKIEDNFKNNSIDPFNTEGAEGYNVPPRTYSQFNSIVDFEKIFSNINQYSIDEIYDKIVLCFRYIDQSSDMLSINTDIPDDMNIEDLNNFINANNLDRFDYNIFNNNLNLCIWLNKRACNDQSFIEFLNNLKHILKIQPNLNISNFDLFEENFMQDTDMLNLFLKENFFYLDAFTLSMNQEKYSLAYLLFMYKISKNIQEYENYYDTYCHIERKKYNKTVYEYHKNLSTKLDKLYLCFANFVKFKQKNMQNKIWAKINNFNTPFKFYPQNRLYKLNKNTIKLYSKKNIGVDFNALIKSIDDFEHVPDFTKTQILNEPVTFDEFIYRDVDIMKLKHDIEQQKQKVQNLLIPFKFENNKLLNADDLDFYLYHITGYEQHRDYNYLFYECRDHEFLKFRITEDTNELFNKIDFQKNYAKLYFHYILKLFKNLKQLVFSVNIENLAFEDSNFVYPNFDASHTENRVDYLYFLECFLKHFKNSVADKHENIKNLINYITQTYQRFLDYNESANYESLYDPAFFRQSNEATLDKWETILERLDQLWTHCLERFVDLKTETESMINMFKLDKLDEFFDYPMFQNLKGFLLLKYTYLNVLEEFVIEDRMFDHAANITTCLYKTYLQHYEFFRRDILLKNSKMPRLEGLSLEDWDYVFQLESQNPLILIELYNSKQSATLSEPWDNDISCYEIARRLSSFHEKEYAYDTLSDDWLHFLNKMKNRDVVIYTLNEEHIFKLQDLYKTVKREFFKGVNYKSSDELGTFLDQNKYTYIEDKNIFVKLDEKSNKSNKVGDKVGDFIKNDDHKKKKASAEVISNVKNEVNKQFISYNSINNESFYIKKESQDIIFNHTIFFNILDNFLIEIPKIKIKNKDIFEQLNSLIKEISHNEYNHKFNLYLLYLSYLLKDNYNYKKPGEFNKFFNYILYLLNFYDNIQLFNNLNWDEVNHCTQRLLLNDYKELDSLNKNFISILFPNDNKNKESDSLNFKEYLSNKNNIARFIYDKGISYLTQVSNSLYKINVYNKFVNSNNFSLNDFQLTHYIRKRNYFNENLFEIYDSNMFEILDNQYNMLSEYILHANNMLNQLNIFKDILNIYLNYCDDGKNNLYILKEIYLDINAKKKVNCLQHLSLMNLLLYIKDPIYLYNILLTDLNLYIDDLLQLLKLIKQPNFNIQIYKKFTYYIFYNLKLKDVKDLKDIFNLNLNTKTDSDLNLNVNKFYSIDNIILFNTINTNLMSHSTKGYFNFNNIIEFNNANVKPLNLLELFNVNKLIEDFDLIFSVSSVKGLKFYDLEIFDYFGFDSLLVQDDFNYEHFLRKIILAEKHSVNISNILKEKLIKDTQALSDLKNLKKNKKVIALESFRLHSEKRFLINTDTTKFKSFKRKSIDSHVHFLKNLKKKKLKKIRKIQVTNNVTPFDFTDYNVDTATSIIEEFENQWGEFQYEILLDVTDSDNSDNSDEDINNQYMQMQQAEIAKNEDEEQALAEIKGELALETMGSFRQWHSDLEYNEAYSKCKKMFNSVLVDLKHPIWDDVRDKFVSTSHFYSYIKKLKKEDVKNIFNAYWDLTIQEVMNKRAKEKQEKMEGRWFSLLNMHTQKYDRLYADEVLKIFSTNLKNSTEWKKQWHNDLHFVQMNKQRFSTTYKKGSKGINNFEENFKISKKKKLGQIDSGGVGYIQPTPIEWKEKSTAKLWNRFNWWKKW